MASNSGLDKISSFIDSRLTTVSDWATDATDAATTALDSIGTFDAPSIELTAPEKFEIPDGLSAPEVSGLPSTDVTNSPVSSGFTSIAGPAEPTIETVSTPAYGTAVAAPDLPIKDMPVFSKTFTEITAPTMPNAPAASFSARPELPIPDRPTMDSIKMTEYAFPAIAAFEADLPHYDITADQDKFDEKFSKFIDKFTDVFETLKDKDSKFDTDKVKDLIEGKETLNDLLRKNFSQDQIDILKADLQEVINKVDKETVAAIKQVLTKYGSRNFPSVYGPAVAEITELETEANSKIREARSQIAGRMNELIMKDYSFAMGILTTFEKHAFELVTYEAQKNLEIEKLRVNAQIELFNATVNLYNMEQDARRSYLDAYKAELEARLRVVETYQPMMDVAIAQIAQNEPELQMYAAEMKVNRAEAEAYSTYLKTLAYDIKIYNETVRGVKAEADTTAVNVEAYREAVKAYAAGVETSGTSIAAFAAQVQAASSAVEVSNSNVQAYTEYVQQTAKQYEVYKAYAAGHSDVIRANISAFQSAAQVEDSRVRALIAAAEGKADLASAKAAAISNVIPVYSAYNRAKATESDAARAYALAAAENAAQAQSLSAMAQAATDKVNAGAKAAAAVAAAALAQGAMSAMYVSKSAQGSAATSDSFSRDTSASRADSIRGTTSDVKRAITST